MIIEIDEIMSLIPHRHELLMIERVENFVCGESGTGVRLLKPDDWFFRGHFPENPVFPGVLAVESLAQTAAVVMKKTAQICGQPDTRYPVFLGIENTKFKRIMRPEDVVRFEIVKTKSKHNLWKFRGTVLVDDLITVESEFTGALID